MMEEGPLALLYVLEYPKDIDEVVQVVGVVSRQPVLQYNNTFARGRDDARRANYNRTATRLGT